MNRTDIVRGPAVVKFRGATIYTEDDITLDPEISTFEIQSSVHGKVDERLDNILMNVSLKPEGYWNTTLLSAMYPYANPVYGSSVFGATDQNVVIQTLAGQEITLKAGAVTGMPELTLGANKTLYGSLQITCIGQQNTAWSDAAKRAVIAAKAFAETGYDPSNVVTVPYTGAWGSAAPWNAIETQEGWTLTFDVALDDVSSDADGIIDKTLGSVGVMAKCTPLGISESQLLDLLHIQGSGLARGASLLNNAQNLVIQGPAAGDPLITLYNVAPKTAGFRFGQTTLRAGEIGFVGLSSFTSGVRNPMFALSSVV